MTLETIKTTRLVGNLKIEENLIKQYIVDIDENGISTVNEYVHNPSLYAENRTEMRKQEAEFRDEAIKLKMLFLADLQKDLLNNQLRKASGDLCVTNFLSGIFSLVASLVGTFGGIITSTKLINYQINELKKRVDKHNNVIERTFKLEEHSRYVDERIARLESEVEK